MSSTNTCLLCPLPGIKIKEDLYLCKECNSLRQEQIKAGTYLVDIMLDPLTNSYIKETNFRSKHKEFEEALRRAVDLAHEEIQKGVD